MELEKLEATIEAVLFAMGNAVSVEKIATAIGHDTETTRKLVHQMMDRYNQREGGLEIIELDDAFQLCTRREYYDALIRVAKQPKKYVLTDVQLEVLSIVAYKQPVTRQEVEKIRGVNSDHALNRLVRQEDWMLLENRSFLEQRRNFSGISVCVPRKNFRPFSRIW